MNVILSIKPGFVEKIFSAEKQYEYRKIPEIICETPANIWQQTKDHSNVSKSFWKKYYAGKDKGVALKIKECKKYIQEFMDMGLMATSPFLALAPNSLVKNCVTRQEKRSI